jgi:hypothetical protein
MLPSMVHCQAFCILYINLTTPPPPKKNHQKGFSYPPHRDMLISPVALSPGNLPHDILRFKKGLNLQRVQ